jgi:CheY-like chemotaxis protein
VLAVLGLDHAVAHSVRDHHGQAALNLLRRSAVNLILLDMRMPVMDGWTFASLYRQQAAPCAPIVLITAAQDAARCST